MGKKKLSVFQIAIMTTVSVASLRGLPAMAIEGWSSILMYIAPALVFLVPTALVGAELGTTYNGGVYVWVKEAFGEKIGFLAIWLQWIHNAVWYPIQLAFIGSAIAFMLGKPELSNSGVYTVIVIIVVYWSATGIALRGGDTFAKFSSAAGIIGTLIPAGLLIVLGALWLGTGQPITESFTQSTAIPKITGVTSLVLIIANVLAYSGMEMNAVHAREMENPRKEYAKAILIATVLILSVLIIPTLAIAIAVPAEKIGMANGIMVAFSEFFHRWNVGWMSNIVSGAIAFGGIASIVTWTAGPSRGVFDAGKTGLLPPLLQKTNKHGIQSGILLLQAIAVTLIAFIYVLVPDVSDVFITLVGMAAALYIIVYIIMFLSAIKLRKSQPDVVRGIKVPALNFVAGVGAFFCLIALIMSFFPAADEKAIPANIYPFVVLGVILLLSVPALVIYRCKKPSWDMRTEEEKRA